MPLYQVAPTRQLPHTIDLIQRQSAPRFANEIERDEQYPDPELGALSVVNTTVEVFNGTGWIAVGGGQPTRINNLQDVDARFPPDGAVLTWSAAAQAWGWTMPATAPEECVTFTDDFERADGAIGSNWALLPNAAWGPYYGTVHPFTIDDGAAVASVDTAGSTLMRWNDSFPGDQFVECLFDNAQGNNGYVQLITHANATDPACYLLEVNHYDDTEPWVPSEDDVLYLVLVRWGLTDNADLGDVELPYPATEPTLFRLESDADGTQRAYVDGVLVLTATDPTPLFGPYIAMLMNPDSFSGVYDSPRILSVTGGCLE